MPKAPTQLYNHASRAATARQLNISSDSSGRQSYSYTSSRVSLPDPTPQASHDEFYPMDVDMDGIDKDHTPGDGAITNEDTPINEDATIEVMPGVHVHIVPPKAKRYANSVGHLNISLFRPRLTTAHSRIFLFKLGSIVGMTILTNVWR